MLGLNGAFKSRDAAPDIGQTGRDLGARQMALKDRQSDDRQHADDGHHDHRFDQGEAWCGAVHGVL